MIRRLLGGLLLDATNRVLSELGYRLVKFATLNGAPKKTHCTWCRLPLKGETGPVHEACLPKDGEGAWPEGWMS